MMRVQRFKAYACYCKHVPQDKTKEDAQSVSRLSEHINDVLHACIHICSHLQLATYHKGSIAEILVKISLMRLDLLQSGSRRCLHKHCFLCVFIIVHTTAGWSLSQTYFLALDVDNHT